MEKRQKHTHRNRDALVLSYSFSFFCYIPVGRILYLLLVNARYRVATLATHLARPWPPANGLHIVIEIIGLHLIILGAAATGCRAASSRAAGIATRCGFASRAHALEMLTGCVHRDHLGGVSAGGRWRKREAIRYGALKCTRFFIHALMPGQCNGAWHNVCLFVAGFQEEEEGSKWAMSTCKWTWVWGWPWAWATLP